MRRATAMVEGTYRVPGSPQRRVKWLWRHSVTVRRFDLPCLRIATLLAALIIGGPLARAQSADDFTVFSSSVDRAADSALEHVVNDSSPVVATKREVSPVASPSADTSDVVPSAIRASGLPVELLMSIVSVESAGNPRALSNKGALGLWQLMPETARRFGLTVTPSIDHRLDPRISTRAALQYLTELYLRFGDWQLTLAAYNAGEGAVERAIRRGNTREFSQLAKWKLLPAETREYVSTVLSRAGWTQ